MERRKFNQDKNVKNKKLVPTEIENWYLLELDEVGNIIIEEDKMMRIPKNSYLKIRFFNGSKISIGTRLITNAYDRNLTIEKVKKEEYLERIDRIEPTSIDSHIQFELKLTRCGPTFVLFSYQDEANLNQINFTNEFFVLVEPDTIQIGKNMINLESIHMQTVLSKSLGKLSKWEEFFREAHLLKYNFIHFTPLQKLGVSESSYCINDNNEISDWFFDEKNLTPEEKSKILQSTVEELRNKYHIGGIIDIVLNHSAENSEWLGKNPQSGFNLKNFPHLNCAYELEVILLNYSQRYSDKKVSCASAPYINNENDLRELINELSREVYKKNLEEYFLIAIDKYIPEFQNVYSEFKEDFSTYLSKKNYLIKKLQDLDKAGKIDEKNVCDLIYDSCSNYGVERYGVEINAEFVSILVLSSMDNKPSESEFLKQIKIYLNKINDIWHKKSKDFLGVAIDNIRAYVKYEFLDLKRFKVTYKKGIVENYFITFDKNKKDSIFACNGWLFGVTDPTINFALYGNWHYFTRSIVIWGDCPKLNYGEKPEDSPYLWEHMTKYVQDMARIFNGFRLDNAHSTPIHVAEYLMKKAREVNEDLIIVAELFAGTKEREISFVNRIGINHLIREAIYCTDAHQLSQKIHQFGGGYENILGKLDDSIREYYLADCDDDRGKHFKNISYKYLSPIKPRSLLFDITHDNPTYYEKFNNLGLNLTFLAIVGMSSASIGTSRGFDQLFPYQPSVVNESRQYLVDDDFKKILAELNEPTEESKKKEENNRVQHTFELNLNNTHTKTENVRLALSSNNWKPDIFLKRINDKKYTVSLNLVKDIHYYKYVLDNGVWINDANAPTVKDSSGNINNILNLKQQTKYVLPDLKLVRREINKIRNSLIDKQSNQIFIHQDRDMVCIFRMFSDVDSDFDGYVLICRTGFDRQNSLMNARVELPGEISEFLFSANVQVPKFDINIIRSDFKLVGVKSDLHFSKDKNFLISIANITNINNKDIIDFHSLMPNTIIAMKIKFSDKVKSSMKTIYNSIIFLNKHGEELLNKFDLCDMNHALYRCEKEELDVTANKRGNYNFNNFGKLVYAGMTSLMQVLIDLKKKQALDSPVFNNIREGDWLFEYEISRLKDAETLNPLVEFLNQKMLKEYKEITNYLKPYFFCIIFDTLYDVFVRKILNTVLLNYLNEKKLVYYNTFFNAEFVQNLIIANLQFTGYVESAKFKTGDKLSISAGLPHFSTEYMRCWGRDTFIAFKGLLLVPGFFTEAKLIIKHFASTMRHGLIPNLLDRGNNSRYNARDAAWFFLQAIKEYLKLSSDFSFLNEEIEMIFLDDEITTHYSLLKQGQRKNMKLYQIVQHIIESHSKGIEFKEWRAGKSIDEQMKDEGFYVRIYLDPYTGFIYGGNKSNCGTWMDKMGSSEKARNKGVPSTPRDGANVEIQGLLYSILTYLIDLNNKGIYPYNSSKLRDGTNLPYYEWTLLLQDNFEKHFYIASKPAEIITSKHSYYKDYLSHPGDTNMSSNYQLRPNYLIAMAVAPELFDTDRAMQALMSVEKYLLVKNGLGIRTLDQEDKLYNGNYINNDDSNNYLIAHGFNYHNVRIVLIP